jgi:DNA-binding transcriptional LysR family regulator
VAFGDGIMSLRQLRYVMAVAEAGSFRKAAETINVSQPALSQEIAKFEAQIGGALLERTGRSITLTDRGRALCGLGEKALRRRDDTVASTIMRVAEQAQSLRIAANSTALATVVPQLLAQVAVAHPDLRLHIIDEFAAYHADLLRNRSIDAAISTDLHHLGGTLIYAIAKFDFILAQPDLPNDRPVPLDDLVALGQVWLDLMPGLDPGRDEALLPFRRRLRQADCRMELVQSTETILTLIRAGRGVAILPRTLADLAIPGIHMAHEPLSAPQHIYAAILPEGGPTAAIITDAIRLAFPQARRIS